MIEEKEYLIRHKIISSLDEWFNNLCDTEFEYFGGADLTEDDLEEIESIMMSYRNVIAGLEWDGKNREYEKYKIKR